MRCAIAVTGRVHAALVGARISQLDRVPAGAAASEIALAIEDVVAAVAGDGNPCGGPALIGDLLALAIGERIHVTVERLAARRGLARDHPRRAVPGNEAAAARPGLGGDLNPAGRDEARQRGPRRPPRPHRERPGPPPQ